MSRLLTCFVIGVSALGCGDAPPDVPSPAAPIAGDPARPVAGAIADLEFDEDGGTYRRDHPALPGLGVSVDTALLVFRLETTVGQANEVLAAEGASIVGAVAGTEGAAAAVLAIRLPTTSHAEMDAAIARLEQAAAVEHVVQDTLVEAQSVPAPNAGDPPGWTWTVQPSGANWGHEAIRMPQVWNLNDGIAKSGGTVPVWVFDVGFDASHPDLARAVPLNEPTVHPHGTHVAGTIGATFDDGVGVDGLDPFVKLGLRGTRTVGGVTIGLNEVPPELEKTGNVPIVNISLGHNWYDYKPPVDPALDPWAQGKALAGAHIFVKAMMAIDARGALPLVVVSAGNSSGPPLGAVHARYNSPWAAASLQLGAANVIVVEATQNTTPVTPYVHSNHGGHVSAPGVDVWSASVGPPHGKPYANGNPAYIPGAHPRFEAMDGTSMAAPHVSGVASYLLAFYPYLERPTFTSNAVRSLLQTHAVPAQGVAPLIDAFATVVATNPDRAFTFLADIDDGTPDGNDRTTLADARGDGKVDMRDFRRFRDWLSQVEGTGHLDGPVDHEKFDLNRDGLLEDLNEENVYPRGDFNGDGVISRDAKRYVPALGDVTDLGVLRERFQDEHYSPDSLPGLLDSGDIAIDASACLARPGVSSVHIRALDGTTYETLEERWFDVGRSSQIMTLPGPVLANLELVALDSGGVSDARSELTLVDVLVAGDKAWKADCVVLTSLTPDQGKAGSELTLAGAGFDPELASVQVIFENPATSDKLQAAITGATLAGSEVTALKIEVPDGVSAASWWHVYVEQPQMRSNKLDFWVGSECITDLDALGGGDGTGSEARAVNDAGDAIWWHTGGAGKKLVSVGGVVTEIPCLFPQDINEFGIVVGYATGGLPRVWEPATPASCSSLPLPTGVLAEQAHAINDAGQVVGFGHFWPSFSSVIALKPLASNGKGSVSAWGINNAGDVVGSAQADAAPGVTNLHAALWKGSSTPIDLGVLPGSQAGLPPGGIVPRAIGDSGAIVGQTSIGPEPLVAGMVKDGVVTPIGKLDLTPFAPAADTSSWGLGINVHEEVVGYTWASKNSVTTQRGMIWLPKPAYAATAKGLYALSDFMPDSKWVVEHARDISDSGRIAATASYTDGRKRAVLIDLTKCSPPAPPKPH